MPLTQRTHAELIRAAESAYTHDDLGLVFMRLGIGDDPGVARVPNRSKVRRLTRAIQILAEDDRVIDLVKELLEGEVRRPHHGPRLRNRSSATTCGISAYRWIRHCGWTGCCDKPGAFRFGPADLSAPP